MRGDIQNGAAHQNGMSHLVAVGESLWEATQCRRRRGGPRPLGVSALGEASPLVELTPPSLTSLAARVPDRSAPSIVDRSTEVCFPAKWIRRWGLNPDGSLPEDPERTTDL